MFVFTRYEVAMDEEESGHQEKVMQDDAKIDT